MGVVSQVSLMIILVLGILSSPRVAGRGHFLLLRLGGWLFGIPALIIAGSTVYITYLQFMVWQNNPFSKYLLPPHASFQYFASYAFMHFWAPYLVSGIIGLMGFWVAGGLNKKFNERFFEREELYFLALGIFLTGHPGWVRYVIVVLLVYMLVSMSHSLVTIRHTPFVISQRSSFYYFWLPCAAATIIASAYMGQFSWYSNLII